jgi:Protein of unknown function (DUF1329)
MTETSGLRRARSLTSLVVLIVLALPVTQPARAQTQMLQASGNAANAPSSTNTAPSANAAAVAPASSGAVVATQTVSDSIAPGTPITMQNWQQYQQFMPDGMVALFQGKYFWKMPADVKIDVGPTVIHPLPKGYVEATEKYSAQTNLVELPDGGLTLTDYRGGIPFPSPAEPHQGWKVLANLWYRYLPHLIVDTYGNGCFINSTGNASCEAVQIVNRQLAFNTDPNTPANFPGAERKFSSEWLMVLEPEQQRYTAFLTISYTDLAKPEDSYIFIPSLRRAQPVSTSARCSPNQGSDSTEEDYRFGFNSNITELKVDMTGEKKVLALLDANVPNGQFPANFDMPLGWPLPSWGKWQVRDVDEISVSKIPSKAAGYCYGKRVMYVDKATYAPLWEDLYDSKMKLWRILGLFLRAADVPGIGPVTASGSMVWAFWDVQNSHATFFIDPAPGHAFYLNDQAPKEFTDIGRYTSAPGLSLIMR